MGEDDPLNKCAMFWITLEIFRLEKCFASLEFRTAIDEKFGTEILTGLDVMT